MPFHEFASSREQDLGAKADREKLGGTAAAGRKGKQNQDSSRLPRILLILATA